MDEMLNFLRYFSKEVPTFIFLGGIHGVGKTTVCRNVFVPDGYHCVTASALITSYGKKIDKDVASVADNQVALIAQLNLEKGSHHRLLLDGHFCLVNSQNQVEPIDLEVFRAMEPSHLILIKGKSEKIIERLNERDGKQWDMFFITQFQIAEENHAKYVSKKLDIPLKIFNNG